MTGRNLTREAGVREEIEATGEERADLEEARDVRAAAFEPETTPNLTGLSEAERDVWVSVELEGFTPLELSRVSERDCSTIRTLLKRARQKRGESDE